jgi:hypothetical protein
MRPIAVAALTSTLLQPDRKRSVAHIGAFGSRGQYFPLAIRIGRLRAFQSSWSFLPSRRHSGTGKNARIHSLTACCRGHRQGRKRAQAPSTPTKITRRDRCFFADADWAMTGGEWAWLVSKLPLPSDRRPNDGCVARGVEPTMPRRKPQIIRSCQCRSNDPGG